MWWSVLWSILLSSVEELNFLSFARAEKLNTWILELKIRRVAFHCVFVKHLEQFVFFLKFEWIELLTFIIDCQDGVFNTLMYSGSVMGLRLSRICYHHAVFTHLFYHYYVALLWDWWGISVALYYRGYRLSSGK